MTMELNAAARAPRKAAGALDAVARWFAAAVRTNGLYALLFAAAFALIWIPTLAVMAALGLSFFWQIDGLSQQYVWFTYTGQWLRELFGGLFGGQGFSLPMWTMDSGFGTDVLQAFVCTALNPFYAVSALVPEEHAENAFELMLVAQMYCSGLTFSAWCVSRGVGRPYAFVGAVAYTFAGNMLCVFTQPGFLFGALVFPLLLLAADRVFERRSAVPFVLLLAWCFAYSFYDAYMFCVMLALYCTAVFLWRVDAGAPRKGRFLRFLRWLGLFLCCVVIALLLSCVFMLPQVMALTGSDRLALDRPFQVLYEPMYYVMFFVGLLSYAHVGSDALTGFNAIMPLVVVVLVAHRREHRALFVGFLVLTLMMLVPLGGRIMNAMAYPTERWDWAYSLCVAYAIAVLMPRLASLSKGEKRAAVVGLLLYGALCAAACVLRPYLERSLVAWAMLAAMLAVSVAPLRVTHRARMLVLAACVACAASLNFLWYFAPSLYGKPAEAVQAGTLWTAHVEASGADLLALAPAADEGSRTDRLTVPTHNSNILTGVMAPDFYSSFYNNGVERLLASLGLVSTEGVNNRYGSLDGRTALEGLLGVRYLVVRDADAHLVPPTFRPVEGARIGDRALYESDAALSLAFVVHGYITEEQYASLPLADRQQALLQAVVLEDDPRASGVEDVWDDLVLDSVDLPFSVAGTSGCSLEGSTIVATEPNAVVRFDARVPEGTEAYLCLEGFDYAPRDSNAPSGLKEGVAALLRQPKTTATVDVDVDGSHAATLVYPNADDAMYGGERDWMCNLGSRSSGTVTVAATLREPGVYTARSLRFAAQPVDSVENALDGLAAEPAGSLEFSRNEVRCSVRTDEGGLLFFSIADSRGWSATVDGQPVPIERADLGFMAVAVSAGSHDVVLTYRTPYIAEGAALSMAGIGALGVFVIARRRVLGSSDAEKGA